MFFAFFAMHLKWLCIVFALLSTLRLSEGQETVEEPETTLQETTPEQTTTTFESVDGRAYGIVYEDVANTLVGRITGGACGTPLPSTDYVEYVDLTTTKTDGCFVRAAAAPSYVGGVGGVNSELQTNPSFAVYSAIATITDATATSASTGDTGINTLLTVDTATSPAPAFYYDCGTVVNGGDGTGSGDYFSFSAGDTADAAATISWNKALTNDPILFLGSIRCLFSHQAGNSPNNYETLSTNSHRVVVDFTIDPPFVADATITCSLNPIAAGAGEGTVVGTYSYGGTKTIATPLIGCKATTDPADLLELQNAANCYGVVTVAAGASLPDGSDVTVTVVDTSDTPTTASCTFSVAAAVVAPTCSDTVSGRVDLQYWRASTTANDTANANVLVDKAIATSPGRALTYSIDANTTSADHYTFEQNTLQVTAAAAATKANGRYTILVNVVDADDSSQTAACEVSLTVGAQNCVP